MASFYQIGPLLDIYYHLFQQSTILVPNEGGAAFRSAIFYDNARIPDEVPSGAGSADNILRPSGFQKGDAYKKPPTNTLTEHAFINPFVVGWGSRIADAYWIEIDQPFNWSVETYPAVYEALKRTWITGYDGIVPLSPNRVFVWVIHLEFTGKITQVVRGVNPPPPEAAVVVTGEDSSDLGNDIPYSKGARRLPGKILWATEIDGGETSLAEPAFGSFAAFFGRPLEQGEEIYCNKIWMEGREVWNETDGVQIEEFNDELIFRVYTGTMDQLPDTDIVADLGADVTPAWRDLIYIVFIDVPLAAFGNRRPSIEAEFLREDGERISVSGVLENVATLGGVDVAVTGVDNMVDGVVFNTMDPRAIIENYKDQFNYRIIDRDPVRIKRNEVNDDLTIDVDLAQTDFVLVDAVDPVVTNELDDDTSIPNQITIAYSDKSQDYQERTQYARLPLFPVAVTSSRANEQIGTEFIITAVEAVEIAWNDLMRRRARQHAHSMRLMPGVLEVEEGDVIRVPTGQGTFVADVVEATLNPDNTQDIKAEFLLPEDEATLTADAGTFLTSGVLKPIYYPNALAVAAKDDILVSNGKIIMTVIDPDRQGATAGVAFASTNIPTRLSYKNIVEPPDPALAGFTPGSGWEVNGLSLNNDYVFAFGTHDVEGEPSDLRITRIDRFDNTSEMLATGLGADPDVDAYFVAASAATDSYLFIAAQRANIDSPEGYDAVLIVVDLADFTEDGVSVVALSSTGEFAMALDVAVVGNRVLVTSVFADVDTLLDGWRLHRYHYKDETLDTVTPTFPLGRSCVSGGMVYYLPANDVYRGNTLNAVEMTNTKGARVDPADINTIEYFDITDDPNITLQQGGQRPWTDGTYLYFIADNCGFHPITQTLTPGYVNATYLAKFDLATLTAQDGLDLTQFFNNIEYQLSAGAYESGFHYLGGWGIALSSEYRHGGGCILKVAADFSYAVFFPASQNPPDNDNFPGIRLPLATTKTFDNRWATKQDGEPDHGGNVGGKSVWYTFIAALDSTYQITISPASEGGFPSNVAVYRGTVIDGLTEIAAIENGHTGYNVARTLNFNAVAGGRYRIVIDGWYGAPGNLTDVEDDTATTHFGRGTIRVEAVAGEPNDDFADALIINPGRSDSARNRYATKEAGEPDHAGNPGGKSLWWKVTVDEAKTLQVSTTSDGPMLLAVYTEGSPPGVSGLVEVVSDSDATGGTDDDYAAWAAVI